MKDFVMKTKITFHKICLKLRHPMKKGFFPANVSLSNELNSNLTIYDSNELLKNASLNIQLFKSSEDNSMQDGISSLGSKDLVHFLIKAKASTELITVFSQSHWSKMKLMHVLENESDLRGSLDFLIEKADETTLKYYKLLRTFILKYLNQSLNQVANAEEFFVILIDNLDIPARYKKLMVSRKIKTLNKLLDVIGRLKFGIPVRLKKSCKEFKNILERFGEMTFIQVLKHFIQTGENESGSGVLEDFTGFLEDLKTKKGALSDVSAHKCPGKRGTAEFDGVMTKRVTYERIESGTGDINSGNRGNAKMSFIFLVAIVASTFLTF